MTKRKDKGLNRYWFTVNGKLISMATSEKEIALKQLMKIYPEAVIKEAEISLEKE